jgi:hypothetical protein
VTEHDERILDDLRQLAREVDPVPDDVTAYAKAALGWRRIDAELAELLSDSALESEALAGTRGGVARARVVSFRASDLELDVEIRQTDAGIVLLGQLAPGGPATIEVQRDDRSTAATLEADRLGRFRAELSEGGRIRMLVRREPPASPVETSWIDV